MTGLHVPRQARTDARGIGGAGIRAIAGTNVRRTLVRAPVVPGVGGRIERAVAGRVSARHVLVAYGTGRRRDRRGRRPSLPDRRPTDGHDLSAGVRVGLLSAARTGGARDESHYRQAVGEAHGPNLLAAVGPDRRAGSIEGRVSRSNVTNSGVRATAVT